jgi:hypothetical protein
MGVRNHLLRHADGRETIANPPRELVKGKPIVGLF